MDREICRTGNGGEARSRGIRMETRLHDGIHGSIVESVTQGEEPVQATPARHRQDLRHLSPIRSNAISLGRGACHPARGTEDRIAKATAAANSIVRSNYASITRAASGTALETLSAFDNRDRTLKSIHSETRYCSVDPGFIERSLRCGDGLG